MHDLLIPADRASSPVPILAVTEAGFERLSATLPHRAFLDAQDFRGQAGRLVLLPGADGGLERVMYGLGAAAEPMGLRGLPARLPPGDYTLDPAGEPGAAEAALLAWALGSYAFDRYKKRDAKPRPRLVVPDGIDADGVRAVAEACWLARDLVNTPANDMGPLQLETVAREIAQAHGARLTVTTGEALLEQNYPAVHAVGRAATDERAPRMIELSWNADRADLPLVALVGKGVVFDTGGLDIKPSAGMRLMKKDMGGAAHALALGRLVMQAGLAVRLAVLVPAVENAIGSDAFRPGDVIGSRKGLTIEVGNTDAEGRLILADALTRAAELSPELTVDFATLTGAARVALGPELPPVYTPDDALAAELAAASVEVADPMWRMPLWRGYRDALDAEIADLRNDPAEWAQAGSVTAALFLQKFAPETGAWAHFDIFAWNPRGRPGWPVGGEAQAIRAVFEVLKRRYGLAR